MSNIISQFFYGPTGTSFNDDSDLLDLVSNSVITNMTTGEKFKKIDTNVFNKKSFGTVGGSQTPVYFSNGVPEPCSLATVFGVSRYSGGYITHGESYIDIVLDLGRSPTQASFYHFQIRIGSIAINDTDSFTAIVEWDKPLESFDAGEINIQVTPSRGANGGNRWGDDYFCLFTQNISKDGFEIYSNHLGGANGRVDYIVTRQFTTH